MRVPHRNLLIVGQVFRPPIMPCRRFGDQQLGAFGSPNDRPVSPFVCGQIAIDRPSIERVEVELKGSHDRILIAEIDHVDGPLGNGERLFFFGCQPTSAIAIEINFDVRFHHGHHQDIQVASKDASGQVLVRIHIRDRLSVDHTIIVRIEWNSPQHGFPESGFADGRVGHVLVDQTIPIVVQSVSEGSIQVHSLPHENLRGKNLSKFLGRYIAAPPLNVVIHNRLKAIAGHATDQSRGVRGNKPGGR